MADGEAEDFDAPLNKPVEMDVVLKWLMQHGDIAAVGADSEKTEVAAFANLPLDTRQ